MKTRNRHHLINPQAQTTGGALKRADRSDEESPAPEIWMGDLAKSCRPANVNLAHAKALVTDCVPISPRRARKSSFDDVLGAAGPSSGATSSPSH